MIGAIHAYEITLDSSASVTPEGRVVATTTTTRVEGSVDELSARDVEIAAQVGQTHDIACRAPLETAVTDRHKVLVTEPAKLAGTYDVDAVRVTRKHLRILCSRSTVRS